LLAHGTALPPCPLVYPLLNEKGKMTALGSYLSYFSMKEASYLPKTVFLIPNAGEIYNEFDLFTPDSPKHGPYRDQLPYYFGNVKDFGEGKLLKAGKGYQIKLRFWGTKSEKKYAKKFKKGSLHLAIGWMSACLQDYEGFRPNADQKGYRDNPIFKSDEDLKRGAELETFFRNGGRGLVTGWENILAKNQDNPYLFDRWLAILDSRGDKKHLVLIQQLLQKNPDNTFSKLDYLVQCYEAEKYDEGINLGLQELTRDDNNPDWYDLTVSCLEGKGFYEEAIQLLQAWTKLHPDNQEAFMKLKDTYVAWAWVARGSGWASTVTPEGAKLMEERMGEAVVAGVKACQVAPGDCRVWSKMLGLGNGANFDAAKMQDNCEKMFELNPYRTQGYDAYLEYLKPKWNGTQEEMLDFAKKYDAYDPGLWGDALEEVFQVYSDDDSVEGKQKRIQAIRINMKDQTELTDFEKSKFGYLKIHPENLNEWAEFIGWEDLAGRQEAVLDEAKKLSQTNPELKALPAALFIDYTEQAKNNIPALEDQEAFDQRPDILERTEQAFRHLAEADPGNWAHLNYLAFYGYKLHNLDITRRALKSIGSNWSPEVWPQVIFNKAVSLCQQETDGYWTGTFPCPNHCLQFDTGEWVHLAANGHSDSDLWQKFYNDDGSGGAYSEAHIGHVIKKVNGSWVDTGVCPVCQGKGWVPKTTAPIVTVTP
jgi:hypothetical protein